MNTVAERVKFLRQHLKLTQEALGQCAGGISKQAVSQWERGITEPQWEALNALQRTRQVNPQWLLKGTAPMLLSEEAGDPRPQPLTASRSHRIEQRPFAELLDELSRRLALADPSVREEVTRLVLRYMENPQAGARIAQGDRAAAGIGRRHLDPLAAAGAGALRSVSWPPSPSLDPTGSFRLSGRPRPATRHAPHGRGIARRLPRRRHSLTA